MSELSPTQAVLQEIAAEANAITEYNPWSDEEHGLGDLLHAGTVYLLEQYSYRAYVPEAQWPFWKGYFKPGTARDNLVKAAAFFLLEIERLDRKEKNGD